VIAKLVADMIKLAKEATDRTKEIISTGDVLILGALLFYISQNYLLPAEPLSSNQSAMVDAASFLIGTGLLFKKFWLYKFIGVFVLALQIMNTSLMIIIAMKNSATPL